MSSRRYKKRVWRVPKDRGPAAYMAALVTKALVKHGWPAVSRVALGGDGFVIEHDVLGHRLPPDMAEAVEIAVRIVARTYRVDVFEHAGSVGFNRPYRVGPGGHFVEVKE